MTKLADHLGISAQSINKWNKVPLEYVFHVSEFCRITPYALRPDFFKDDPLRNGYGKAGQITLVPKQKTRIDRAIERARLAQEALIPPSRG